MIRRGQEMEIKSVPFAENCDPAFRKYQEGYRSITIHDDDGKERGVLVWRLGTGRIPEITDIFIHDDSDQRKGYGTQMLRFALREMDQYCRKIGIPFRRVYVFTWKGNKSGESFYLKSGFRLGATVKDLYGRNDAQLYILNVEGMFESTSSKGTDQTDPGDSLLGT
jgi:GNAT superfamily N-acetyltransferase